MIFGVKIGCTKSSSRSRNNMVFFEDAKNLPQNLFNSFATDFHLQFLRLQKIILNNFLKIIYSFYILKNSLFFLEQISETKKIINHPHEVKIRKILRHGFFYKNLLFFIKCSECLETYNKHKNFF